MMALLANIPWAIVLIMLPLVAALVCVLWSRWAILTGLLTASGVVLAVLGLGWQLWQGGVYHHAIGGWGAPLGIELMADGLSLLMLSITALVGLGVSVYSAAYFDRDTARHFWPLWLFLLAALNALFLSADIFNLYVTLELMGLAAVALAALAGGATALSAAMRYLLAALFGSLLYLLGVALLYHGYGTLDIALLATRVEASPALWAALAMISAGLALKTALFPLHFWLPPAHASAPAPVSALLSALVVKASLYILLRLWLSVFSPLAGAENIAAVFGVLGAAAVIWGSLQALRQSRLKLMVAYSTVAQLGYMFMVFPLAAGAGLIVGASAWNATAYLVFSHALAKAAMFLAAGNLLRFGEHDRIADLDRVAQRLPLTVAAFGIAGVSIIGLPPSGGFIGKWLLLEAALGQGRWDLAVVMILGSLLAAAYIFKVLGHAFTQASVAHAPREVHACMEWAALLLAIAALLLGFVAVPVLALLGIGDAFVSSGVLP